MSSTNSLYNRQGIDSTAIVSPNARIGKNNYIGPGVIIGDNVIIGDGNYIGPYCVIGMPPESKEWHKGYTGEVIIGNNNRIYKQTTIDGGTESTTRIFHNCLLLKNSHVGHDALIGDEVILGCNAVIGGWCTLGKGARVDLNSVVNPRVLIPEGVRIGSLSTVLKSSKMVKGRTYAGNPIQAL